MRRCLLLLMTCVTLAAANAAGTPAVPARAAPVTLDDRTPMLDVWPALRLLADADRSLIVDSALARLDQFAPPVGAHASLGFRKEAIWLYLPLQVAPQSAGKWVLNIDYPQLNRIDVHLISATGHRQLAVMGNLQPFAERPLASRTPAVALDLEPGERYELLLRVDTNSALVMPIFLGTPAAFHLRANNEFLLQGFLLAIGVFLLLFSLQQWIGLGDRVYGKYALLTLCNQLFCVHLFGLGALYLWTDNPWLETHIAGISSLLTSCATALFIEDVLATDIGPRLRRALKGLAAVLALSALLFVADAIDIHAISIIMGVLGLLPALLGLPGAIARMRRGDHVGTYFIVAWLGYFITGATLYGVVTGILGASFWTLHSYQFGAAFDMLIFARIAILRSAAEHRAARQASRERDTLHSLAHTDSLTGLGNRRGLNAALAEALPRCTPQQMLAIYVLDLDGFKPVNDRYGHDVGDELLRLIGRQLRATVRQNDFIARLGGDEFIVLASGVQSEQQAAELGEKLLAVFRQPFAPAAHNCNVGVTIGYVMAPTDGDDAGILLKTADAAMYGGKQAGKGVLVRGDRIDGDSKR